MSKPMFFFTGVYETVAQAEEDYDAIKHSHKAYISDPMTPRCSQRTARA
jgi:hypothetical protein